MKYIDVSVWQGKVDFEKVRPNVDGVILRAGYGRGTVDAYFQRNVEECNRLNISVGAYWFSYAKNASMAIDEARFLLDTVAPYNIELPLAFDFEYDSVSQAKASGVTITKELASDMAVAFCETIESAGYYVLLYSNPDFLANYYDDRVKRFGLWLAQYPVAKVFDKSKPPHTCDIWQWGTSAVPGINGVVDTNESYHDFKTIIKNAKLNKPQSPKSGAEWALENGIITDIADSAIGEAIYRYHKAFGK